MRQAYWKDATSYSQGQRGKSPQTAWETEVDGLRIWVSCGHLLHPDRWVMNCSVVGLKNHDLGGIEIPSEQARDRAVMEVYHKAGSLAQQMQGYADSMFAVSPLSADA